MEFRSAVASFFAQYATFSGRARRSEFWWTQLFLLLVAIVTSILDSALFGVEVGEFGLFGIVSTLGLIVPSLAVTWRRLHDIGKSGGFFFLALIPLVGVIILIVWLVKDSDPEVNAFGSNPKSLAHSKPQTLRGSSPRSLKQEKLPSAIWGPNRKSNAPLGLFAGGAIVAFVALTQLIRLSMDLNDVSGLAGVSRLDDGELCRLSNLFSVFDRDCPPTRRMEIEQELSGWVIALLVGLGLIVGSILLSRREQRQVNKVVKSSPAGNQVSSLQVPHIDMKNCPMCAEEIRVEAKLCKHCGTKLEA
jgi:uncharacterized membrane protein YhaH (DUF805 family)